MQFVRFPGEKSLPISALQNTPQSQIGGKKSWTTLGFGVQKVTFRPFSTGRNRIALFNNIHSITKYMKLCRVTQLHMLALETVSHIDRKLCHNVTSYLCTSVLKIGVGKFLSYPEAFCCPGARGVPHQSPVVGFYAYQNRPL